MAWLTPGHTVMTPASSATRASVRCALLGHKVHHTRIARDRGTPCARCGTAILDQDRGLSRVAHTLSCFFGSHHYFLIATRSAHHEYICERCGHSLLFESVCDPCGRRSKFAKRVSYGCGLFGHRVHVVGSRSNATEYACRCGHPFVKASPGLNVIRHPLACVLLGHFIALSEIRSPWAEYVCRRCGHPFYFKLAAFDQLESEAVVRTYE
jgi:DNA-directed RNA polymerase subunit RPC12/RpoP